jgi:hypothetical protein
MDFAKDLNTDVNSSLSNIKVEKNKTNCRDLYHALTDIESNYTYLWPAFIFGQSVLDDIQEHELSNKSDISAVFNELISNNEASVKISELDNSEVVYEHFVYQYAPLGMIPCTWFKSAARLVYAEKNSGLLIQEIAKKWQIVSELSIFNGGSIRNEYQKLAKASIESTDPSFSKDEKIKGFAFEYAIIGQYIGIFQEDNFAESVGYNYWQATVGLEYLMESLGCNLNETQASLIEHLREESKALIALLLDESSVISSSKRKIIRGFTLAQEAFSKWLSSLQYEVTLVTPRSQMLKLIEGKAKYAVGFHENIKLAGKGLDTYFAGGKTEHISLLDKLLASPFINIANPDISPLISESSYVEGKMFGIFTERELSIIKEWVLFEKETDRSHAWTRSDEKAYPYREYSGQLSKKDFYSKAKVIFNSKPINELTYYIANFNKFPMVYPILADCAQFSSKVLQKCSDVSCPENYIPAYSIDVLDGIVENNRQLHNMKYQTDKGPYLKDAALINKYVETYPGFCTDGCWLDGTFQPGSMHNEEVRILYDIYRDENGAGNFEGYHNLIARQLLMSMGFEFPSLDSREFYVQDDIKTSFTIPFLQYSLSSQSKSFLPEVLGVNLLLETNDVGAVNRRNAKELKADGYNSLYMDLHIVIDNYASGHGYMAKRAIVSFLEKAGRVGKPNQQALWKRIFRAYNGFHNIYNAQQNPAVRKVLSAVNEYKYGAETII